MLSSGQVVLVKVHQAILTRVCNNNNNNKKICHCPCHWLCEQWLCDTDFFCTHVTIATKEIWTWPSLTMFFNVMVFHYCGFCSNRILLVSHVCVCVCQLVTGVTPHFFSIKWLLRPYKPYVLTNLITMTTWTTLTTWTTWTPDKRQTTTNDKQWQTTNNDKRLTMTKDKQNKRQTKNNDKQKERQTKRTTNKNNDIK